MSPETSALPDQIRSAAAALNAGPSVAALAQVGDLAQAPALDLLTSLLQAVSDASTTVDSNQITASQIAPDVESTRGLIAAVRAGDADGVRSAVGGGYPETVVALLGALGALITATPPTTG